MTVDVLMLPSFPQAPDSVLLHIPTHTAAMETTRRHMSYLTTGNVRRLTHRMNASLRRRKDRVQHCIQVAPAPTLATPHHHHHHHHHHHTTLAVIASPRRHSPRHLTVCAHAQELVALLAARANGSTGGLKHLLEQALALAEHSQLSMHVIRHVVVVVDVVFPRFISRTTIVQAPTF